MSDYEQQADRAERELDDMQRRSKRLEEEIAETREEWERKQRDPQVPTAQPPAADEDGPPPEAEFPSKGD